MQLFACFVKNKCNFSVQQKLAPIGLPVSLCKCAYYIVFDSVSNRKNFKLTRIRGVRSRGDQQAESEWSRSRSLAFFAGAGVEF